MYLSLQRLVSEHGHGCMQDIFTIRNCALAVPGDAMPSHSISGLHF